MFFLLFKNVYIRKVNLIIIYEINSSLKIRQA